MWANSGIARRKLQEANHRVRAGWNRKLRDLEQVFLSHIRGYVGGHSSHALTVLRKRSAEQVHFTLLRLVHFDQISVPS
jgi:hypothetical protein